MRDRLLSLKLMLASLVVTLGACGGGGGDVGVTSSAAQDPTATVSLVTADGDGGRLSRVNNAADGTTFNRMGSPTLRITRDAGGAVAFPQGTRAAGAVHSMTPLGHAGKFEIQVPFDNAASEAGKTPHLLVAMPGEPWAEVPDARVEGSVMIGRVSRLTQAVVVWTLDRDKNRLRDVRTQAPGDVTWPQCATEDGVCRFTVPSTVTIHYGVDATSGLGTVQTFTNVSSVACNNTTFGDPSPGFYKRCFVRTVEGETSGGTTGGGTTGGGTTGGGGTGSTAANWIACAQEYGRCTFPTRGNFTVAYGTSPTNTAQLATRDFVDATGTSCGNEVFGDPAPGFVKRCYYREESGTTTGGGTTGGGTTGGGTTGTATTWVACGGEYQSCTLPMLGTYTIRYGVDSTSSTQFSTQVFTNVTSVMCSNALLGDPAPGFVKRCFYAQANSAASNVAPAFTLEPSNAGVAAGQTASFSVSATGSPAPTYQWQTRGAATADPEAGWTPISGAIESTYTTGATNLAQHGAQFRVLATNATATVASQVATLSVVPFVVAPTITSQPTSMTVTAGGNAVFTVTAAGSTPLGYQWSRNGVALLGANASQLAHATTADDAGSPASFTVVITNGAGSVTSAPATLTVNSDGGAGTGGTGGSGVPPTGNLIWTLCAYEGSVCVLPALGDYAVIYGVSSTSTTQSLQRNFTNVTSIACTNDVFGDPARGFVKRCYYGTVDTTGGGPGSGEGSSGVVTTPGFAITDNRGVFINEVNVANFRGALDEEGDPSDWVELVHAGTQTVTLTGWGLSNKADTPFRWVFPVGTTIQPGAHLRVWLSKKDRGTAATSMHTSFNLDNGGETVFLTAPNGVAAGVRIDEVSIPTQRTDTSFCRVPSASAAAGFQHCVTPTPGSANTGAAAPTLLPAPTADVGSGVYASAPTVTLAGPAGATVRYTVDGSEPNAASAVYSAPLAMGTSQVLRAASFAVGSLTSRSDAWTYVVDSAAATRYAQQRMAFVTMTPSDQLLYRAKNKDVYFKTPLELFERDGIRLVKADLESDVAGSIGSLSRHTIGLNFSFRDALGAKSVRTTVPLWAEKPTVLTVKKFRLRNGGNDGDGAHLRDQFAQSLAVAGPNITSSSSSVAMFINGRYEGLFDLREREGPSLIESNLGGDNDNVDFMKDDRSVADDPSSPEGHARYIAARDFVVNNDMTVRPTMRRHCSSSTLIALRTTGHLASSSATSIGLGTTSTFGAALSLMGVGTGVRTTWTSPLGCLRAWRPTHRSMAQHPGSRTIYTPCWAASVRKSSTRCCATQRFGTASSTSWLICQTAR